MRKISDWRLIAVHACEGTHFNISEGEYACISGHLGRALFSRRKGAGKPLWFRCSSSFSLLMLDVVEYGRTLHLPLTASTWVDCLRGWRLVPSFSSLIRSCYYYLPRFSQFFCFFFFFFFFLGATWVCRVLSRAARPALRRVGMKTLTSLNKESRLFFLGDNSIWSFPSVASLSDYSIWRS